MLPGIFLFLFKLVLLGYAILIRNTIIVCTSILTDQKVREIVS